MGLLSLLSSLLPKIDARVWLAGGLVVVGLGFIRSCQASRTAQRQAESAAAALKSAYEHPRVEVRTVVKTQTLVKERLVAIGTTSVRELPTGERVITVFGTLTEDSTTQVSSDVAVSSAAAPVLPPELPGAVKSPGRLVWAGWADGWMGGAGLRLYRDLYLAGGGRYDEANRLRPTAWAMVRF